MFLLFSLILSKSGIKSMIENCSVISHWLGSFGWNDCLFVSNWFLIPMHDSIIIKISILPAWLYCFSLPFLQWYWIRIVVTINQLFISIIIIVITNDTLIIYWTFTNDDDCNLLIIMVWIGLNQDCSTMIVNWLLRIIITMIGFDSDTMEWFEWIDIW